MNGQSEKEERDERNGRALRRLKTGRQEMTVSVTLMLTGVTSIPNDARQAVVNRAVARFLRSIDPAWKAMRRKLPRGTDLEWLATTATDETGTEVYDAD